MTVNLKLNNKTYILQLHEMDIWDHSATISQQEIVTLIKEIYINNPDIQSAVAKGAKVEIVH